MTNVNTLPDGEAYRDIADVPRDVLEEWYKSAMWMIGCLAYQNGGHLVINKSTVEDCAIGRIYVESDENKNFHIHWRAE